MDIVQYEETIDQATVVTIGSFDGVHRGHHALIERTQQIARARHLASVAVTFDPHPSVVLRGMADPHLITPLDLKLQYLDEAGVDMVKVLPFTREMSQIPPFPFLELEIAEALKAEALVVGYNFTFGAGGSGTPETIEVWGASRGVTVDVVPPVEWEGQMVSSSAVRTLIKEGHVDRASRLLGHPFAVQARVSRGERRGHDLGYPTANLIPPGEQILPPYGIYAGHLWKANVSYPSVASWGVRPTFDGQTPILEVHVLDGVEHNFYHETVRFEFAGFLRAEEKFSDTAALISQIGLDVQNARRMLGS